MKHHLLAIDDNRMPIIAGRSDHTCGHSIGFADKVYQILLRHRFKRIKAFDKVDERASLIIVNADAIRLASHITFTVDAMENCSFD